MEVACGMNILVLNAGSSSLKYELWQTSLEAIAAQQDKRILQGEVERATNVDEAFAAAFEQCAAGASACPIEAVGHRVVHGGDVFHSSVIVNDDVERQIDELSVLAPLHNPHALAGIRAARKHLPDVENVAVFDTAFHHTLPPHAYAYGLPYDFLKTKKIRRYGFHGISHRYVAWRFAQIQGKTTAHYRLITCHLGNGCSVCAVEHGRSVDTSMGFTPLEGLMMGTRSGDVDAGAILHLITHEKWQPADVLQMLNKESGLKGISGVSNDMRDVLKRASEGDERSHLAIETFCYRVRKYIGSYLAAMNGADAVIFTGGIGENSPGIRMRICEGLTNLGVTVDGNANLVSSREPRRIGWGPIHVWVVPTQEELLIARDTLRCIVSSR
jgi:acetate kinase